MEFYRAIHDTGDFNAALNSASKSLTGTGLAALGFMLAKMGKARGKEDDEKLASYEKNVQGLGNYSLVLDDGTTISLDWLQPESAAFFVGVEAAELAEDGWQADDFMSLLGSTTDIALNMSFMSGANDFIGEIANSHGNQKAAPSLLLNAFLKYASQGLTNSLAGQAEQAFEKYRQTYYTDPNSPISTDVQKQLAKLSGKTPGIDYQQADYIDAWGRKQDNGPLAGRIAESFFSPAYINEDRSTPVDDELKRLHESVGEEIEGSVFPSIAQRSTEIGGVRLAPEEYDIYATTAGQRSLELVTDFINSPGYADLDDKTKAETIKKLYGYAKTDAKNAVLEARGEEPVTDKAYEKAKTIMNDAGLSWAEYFNVESGRDVNGDGNNSQEETVSYLLGSGLDDDKAEAVYNALYPTSQKPYSEIRDKVQGIEDAGFESLDAFNAIADAVAEARSAAKDEFDSAGNIEAAQLVKDADLTDEQKDMLIGKVSSKFVDFYNVARENGYGANDAIDLLLAIDATPGGKNDTPNNGSVSQGELKAYYKEHPEDEVIIALLWNSKNYSAGTWEEIKGKIK
ncbi:MAG: hypothetical protein ILP16_08200 [Spirochaetales bacterium]|nr:hypothetical protein [Spirochaetales bacterium]